MSILQIYYILRSRWPMIAGTIAVAFLGTFLLVTYLPRKYTATTTLVVDFHEPALGGILPKQLTDSYMTTQIDIIRSMNVALKVVDELGLADSEDVVAAFQKKNKGRGSIQEWEATEVLEDLAVVPSRESRVVTLSYTSKDPEMAAALANAFANAYSETTLELSVEPARRTAKWFDRERAELRKRLDAAQNNLALYEQEKGILEVEEHLDIETARLTELSRELVSAEARRNDAESREREKNRLLAAGESLETLPEVASNLFIQRLKSEVLTQESELSELSKKLGRNHPQYQRKLVEVDEKRQQLKQAIQEIAESLTNNATVAREGVARARQDVEAQRTNVMELRSGRDAIPALEREVQSAERAYDLALQRYNETALQSRVNDTNIAILNRATVPHEHSSPRVALSLALALFIGGVLGVAGTLLLEIFDARVHSSRDIVEGIGLPLLGVIQRS